MRKSLGSLTTRGRSFLTAGITAVICAFVLGERDLLRAGVLVIALPLLCALTVSRTRYRLACTRGLEPSRIPAGHEARVDLRLDNVSRLPTGLLLVEDRVPYTLGGRTRFVLDRIEPRGVRELAYRVRSDVRGRYRLGPLSVRLADPFGLVELARSFTAADSLVVTPAIVALPPGRLAGSWHSSGDSQARAVSAAGEGDVAPREYRHGDDLRRVHWKSTARYGELMVRREEQQLRSSGSLFLDSRRCAHRGEGAASSFEQAVSVTASIGVHLGRQGFGLRLITDSGTTVTSGGTFESTLLDTLAVARMSRHRSLHTGLAELRGAVGGSVESDGIVVGVFCHLDAAETREVAAARRGSATYLAILIDTDWPTPSPRQPQVDGADGGTGGAGAPATTGAPGAAGAPDSTAASAHLLRAAGWRVICVRSAAALADAWTLAKLSAENRDLQGFGNPTTTGGTR